MSELLNNILFLPEAASTFAERVDIAQDYRESFGEDAPDPTQIAISADTDDTGSTSRGFVAALAFLGRDEPAPPVTK